MGNTNHSVEREVVILNTKGLHARPVMKFVDLANKFSSSVSVSNHAESVDGKSPMEMMLLAATRGSKLRIRAAGADAVEAVEALAGLVGRRFDEE